MKNKTIITALTVIIASLTTYFFVSIKKEYPQLYNIENDVVSSINKVSNSISNAVKYANYLWKNEGYYIITNHNFGKENGRVELAKNSSENGKILKVNVNCYTNDSFSVVISIINGSLLLKNNISNN